MRKAGEPKQHGHVPGEGPLAVSRDRWHHMAGSMQESSCGSWEREQESELRKLNSFMTTGSRAGPVLGGLHRLKMGSCPFPGW